ncbi:MAG TPA: cytochrome c biogenesis heme-transporting ATPase CcmA [Steroidobacteraceae bacterium]|nr:cytochrome c biogenesis heme-transporting ATPase CcmA [Steroidobacteraceae bacterium]
MNIAPDGLCVEKVHVWRGDRHVLRGVSLDVHPGELMHVSGPNGTGKTTLLRVVSGLLRPEKGSIAWQGRSIAATAAEYQSALAYASHEPALKSDLTALENLRFTVGLKRRVTAAELRSSLERTGVANCADLPARVLSAGQRRRVAMARVLAFRADLWLLDEPYTNLDGSGSSLLSALLAEHVGQGGVALVVAHHELNVAVQTRRLELQ